ncbi:MAG: hypothetical protein ITG02_11685 [Patulibacter sp.]|nr:hypothetical protein [Patulibacter sp.]
MNSRNLRLAVRVALATALAVVMLRTASATTPTFLVLGVALGYAVMSTVTAWRVEADPARTSAAVARAFADVLALCAVIVVVGQPPAELLLVLCAIPLGHALTLPANVIAAVTGFALVGAILVWATGVAVHPEASSDGDLLIAAFSLAASGLVSCLIAVERERRTTRINELSGTLQEMLGQVITAEHSERRRVANLLHDDVLQLLLVTRHDVADALEGEADALPRAADEIDLATKHLRRTIRGLRSDGVEARRLGDGLRSLAEQTAERRRCVASVDVTHDLEGEHQPLVLSLGRDLLREVERRSTPSKIAVRALSRDQNLILTVEHDDPSYPDRAHAESASTLLVTVDQRARAVGGNFSVSRSSNGTRTLTVAVPLGAFPFARSQASSASRRPRRPQVADRAPRTLPTPALEAQSDVQPH